jgi:FKBP-type peptidyl-prolyl cis-trans isomerase
VKGGNSSFVALLCALMVLIAAGCGGSSGSSTSTAASSAPATTTSPPVAERTTSTTPAEPHAAEHAYRREIERDYAPNPYREPAAPGPHPGAKVDRVIVHDVKRGTGSALRPGDDVWADYIEANYTRGNKFLRAWRHFRTENMVMAPDNWMAGLIQGMTGMRPGGRRTIIVPARLSDVDDTDRAPNSYREIVYWDVVLRSIVKPQE